MIQFWIAVEGSWNQWGAWSTCSGATKSRTRTHSNGNTPCSGSDTETGACACTNPSLSISSEQNYCQQSSCTYATSFQGGNVFTDHLPETTASQYWLGGASSSPQTLRILLSCPKDISVINIRNSGQGSNTNHR